METPAIRRIAGTAALACAGLAGFALVAWSLGAWRSATFGPDYVPMARITALLLLVLGSALAWRFLQPDAPGGRIAAVTGAALAATVAALELIRSIRAFVLPWDRWNSGGQAALGDIPLDRMSPLTALAMILTAGAGLLTETALTRRPGARFAAGLMAGAALLIGAVVILGYASGTPIGYVGNGAPMALLTAFAFVALNGAGLLARGDLAVIPSSMPGADEAQRKDRFFSHALIGGTLAALALLAGIGIVYLRLQNNEARNEAFLRLDAITRLKVEQIAQWREERLDDARYLLRVPAIGADLAAFIANPGDPSARAAAAGWLENSRNRRVPYAAVLLFDAAGNLRLSVPAGAVGRGTGPDFAQALAGRDAVLGDIRRDGPADPAHLDILVSLPGSGGTGPSAVVALRIDLVSAFFPLLLDDPMSDTPGEFVLLRREGAEIVRLNDLPGQPGTALTWRRPIRQPDLIGPALAGGGPAHQEARDERGVPTLASFRRVPGSAWIFGARITQTEAFAAQRRELWTSSALVGVLLGATLLGAAVISRQRRTSILQQALRSERERDALARRLALVTRHANDAMLTFDDRMQLVDANERALSFYGYTADEMRGLHASDLRTSGTATDFLAAIRSDGLIFETEHRRKDGSTFSVEVSTRSVDLEGRRHVLSIVRDISERRIHIREIERLNRLYLVLSRINSALVHAGSREALFGQVCTILVETGGFKLAWVGWLDPTTLRLLPAGTAGDEHGYVAQLSVSADPSQPGGRGPTGTAVRENRIHVCNDFMADPGTAPWHAPAARSGIAASIALPLRLEQQVVGALTVYASEKNCFQAREIELLDEAARDISYGLQVFAERARRAEAEANLAAREEVVSTIFSQALDGIVLIDSATRGFVEFNAAAHTTLGYTREAFARLHLGDIELEHDEATIRATFERMRREGGLSFDTRFRTCAGAARDVRVSALMVTIRGREYVSAVWTDITERKRMEAALQDSEERYRIIAENTGDVIWLADLKTQRFTYVSPASRLVHGFEPADLIGAPLTKVMPAATLDFFHRALPLRLAEFNAGNERIRHQTDEVDALHRDGRIIRVEVATTIMAGTDGKAATLLGVTRDLSERRQAEAKLRESEGRLRALFETSLDGVLITDAKTGSILSANPAACAILRRTEAEIQAGGRNLLVDPNDPRLARLLEERRRTGKTQGELTLVRGDGSSFEAEISSVMFSFSENSRAGIVFRDITERRRTEGQLRKLSSIVEQAPLSIVITDLDGRIEYVNPRFCEVTGYTAAEAIGQNPRLLKSGETPGEIYREMWSALGRGESWSGELRNRTKGGEVFIENAVIAPVLDEKGRSTHFVALKEDVTTQKRTVALLERERQVSEMKTRFISVTSHEFRTPMASAMGSVELLVNHLDRLSPGKREELFNRVTTSLRRMTEMLDEILLLNRMDAKRVEATPQVLDLRLLVQNAVEEIRLANHDSHRFDLTVAGETPGFVTDPSLMHHILTNLLGNAVRYSPKGSQVTVRVAVDAAGARIEVEDQGIGIPPADLPRLFQPFERGSNVSNIKGTGLGLSIVKRMIEQLGGTVAIEAPDGGGSRFIVRHPRLQVPEPHP